MELLAEFERLEYANGALEMHAVKRLYDRLQLAVQRTIVALGDLGDRRSGDLLKTLQNFDRQTTAFFKPALSMPAHPFLVPLKDIHADMTPLVGHKATNLAVIGNTVGLPIPDGFVLTARAFDRFMEENDLPGVIDAYLHDISVEHHGSIEERCEAIRRMILQASVPHDIQVAVQATTAKWQNDKKSSLFFAVRSTAIGEDSEISFAGQFATLLNVPAMGLMNAYKEVLASKYTPGAILYRMRYGLDDRTTPMAVLVMAMVPSRASGVIYSRNPSLPDQTDLQISAIHGLGEYLMGGDTAPHVLSVCRRTGRIKYQYPAEQTHWMTSRPDGGTCLEAMPASAGSRPPISDEVVGCLADWGTRLEKHFGAPQDVEWALDTDQGPYILQSRPLGLDGTSAAAMNNASPLEHLPVLHSGGRKACSGIVSGRIFLANQALTETVPPDSILVIPKAAPEYAPTVGCVRGVIAARGSEASHLASVAREFGVPMIVDTGHETSRWVPGQWITLHADTATVYAGRIPTTNSSPPDALTDPFEKPVRRRMRALSHRIIHRLQPSSDIEAPTDPESHTLYDLLCFVHRHTWERLLDQVPKRPKSVRVLRWTRDNAPDDFRIRSKMALPPSKGGGATRGGHPDGESLLRTFLSALSSNRGPEKLSNHTLEMEGYALITGHYLLATMALGSQLAMIEAFLPPKRKRMRIRLRLLGGTDPYYKRCLRTRWLAGVLEHLGFMLRINGALLDGSITTDGVQNSCDVLYHTGRLLVFCRQSDHKLTGPWVVESLKNAFLSSETPSPSSQEDLPPAFTPLAGNWRQATLNGRSVLVQDGAAVGDLPRPPLRQQIGKTRGAYGAFLKQLYQDHFFPLAVVGESGIQDGQIDLTLNLLTGQLACAGGMVFGFRDAGHHFMVGLDAHRKHIVLYEFIHGRRFKRLRKRYPVQTDRWYDISLQIDGLSAHLQVNGVPLMAYTADRSIAGQIGVWAAADSVVVFDGLSLISGRRREIPFSS